MAQIWKQLDIKKKQFASTNIRDTVEVAIGGTWPAYNAEAKTYIKQKTQYSKNYYSKSRLLWPPHNKRNE